MMTMRSAAAMAATVLLGTTACTATFAQDQQLPTTHRAEERQYRDMDKNADNRLTRDEINPDLFLYKDFDRYDTDGNQSIELDEFRDYLEMHSDEK